MTRAGEKLYRDDKPRGLLLGALIRHPDFQRGAREMLRLFAVEASVAVLLGIG
jgi:hypothetical protein